MDIQIDVTGVPEVSARIEQLPGRLSDQVGQAMRRSVALVHGSVSRELRGGTLHARTGNLARALFWRVERVAEGIVGRVGIDSKKAIYGRIQALGGTILPRRGQFLTIPVGPALTGNGVARISAREFIQNPGALGFRSAFVNPRRTAIVGVRPDRSLEAVFALKRRVDLPARNYLAAGYARVRDRVIGEFRAAIRSALSGRGR